MGHNIWGVAFTESGAGKRTFHCRREELQLASQSAHCTVGDEELEEILIEPEWIEWFALTPQQRWAEAETLWDHYLTVGGTLEPEPDTQSPFFDPDAPGPLSAYGGTGLHILRRGGV